MIRLESVTKQFPNGQVAVDHLTLDVDEGETSVLVGPSGCGKATTLKMINRLIEPTSGRIFLDGDDVTHANPVLLRRRVGYPTRFTARCEPRSTRARANRPDESHRPGAGS
jgi:osmoprotectant transport system ATP-binding protein